jgi:hypothetical protein
MNVIIIFSTNKVLYSIDISIRRLIAILDLPYKAFLKTFILILSVILVFISSRRWCLKQPTAKPLIPVVLTTRRAVISDAVRR